MAESLSVLCNELKTIRTYLCKIGPDRRQGEILTIKLEEANLIVDKYKKLNNEVSELLKKGLLPNEEVTLFNKLCTTFNTLHKEILNYCQGSKDTSDTMGESFELKTALNLLHVMTDEETNTKQLIDGIEYYSTILKSDDQNKLIQFVLKSRLSQSAKLKLKSDYDTSIELIQDMRKVLLPKKSATAIQSKLHTIKQNNRSVKDFGSEIAELFVDLTISQADGNSDSFKVLKPLNEKLAIKKFADGLRNRRLSTVIAARNFESLKDAIQAAQEEDDVTAGSTSGEILGMSPQFLTRGQPSKGPYPGQWEFYNSSRGPSQQFYPRGGRGAQYSYGHRGGGAATYRSSNRGNSRGMRGRQSGNYSNRNSSQWNRPSMKMMTQTDTGPPVNSNDENDVNTFFRD
ncbi:uncharacterized protein LOC134791567 [Cydia splendana]|uniref:uncharacterized protein LOC134791567 n=1 Tax=Cydia splendana TaxID=1100963 RepID=UPI00300D544F